MLSFHASTRSCRADGVQSRWPSGSGVIIRFSISTLPACSRAKRRKYAAPMVIASASVSKPRWVFNVRELACAQANSEPLAAPTVYTRRGY